MHYTACRKCCLIADSRRMQAEGLSLCAAAKKLCVSASNLLKWASQGVGGEENHNDNAAVLLQALDDADCNDEPDQRVPDGVLGDSGIAPPPGDVAASAAVAKAGRLRL